MIQDWNLFVFLSIYMHLCMNIYVYDMIHYNVVIIILSTPSSL